MRQCTTLIDADRARVPLPRIDNRVRMPRIDTEA